MYVYQAKYVPVVYQVNARFNYCFTLFFLRLLETDNKSKAKLINAKNLS